MPCHDGPPPPFDLLEARRQIDELTQYMCEAAYLLERCEADPKALCVSKPVQPVNMLRHLSMSAQSWVMAHKAEDQRRKQIEKHFNERIAQALAKLTKEEQVALGVDDWNIRISYDS